MKIKTVLTVLKRKLTQSRNKILKLKNRHSKETINSDELLQIVEKLYAELYRDKLQFEEEPKEIISKIK